jgi:hypothetical protein
MYSTAFLSIHRKNVLLASLINDHSPLSLIFIPLLAPYGVFGLGAGNIFKKIKKHSLRAVPNGDKKEIYFAITVLSRRLWVGYKQKEPMT